MVQQLYSVFRLLGKLTSLIRHKRSDPAVIAVMGHGRTLPLAVLFATPDQRHGNYIMAVTIDVRPHFDRLADDTLHGKAAAIDQRVDIFDMECAAGSGARDGLSCSIHGDAIDLESTPRFVAGKRRFRTYIQSRSLDIGSRGTVEAK